MPGVDQNRAFLPVHIAILTVAAGREAGQAADLLARRARAADHLVQARQRVQADIGAIIDAVEPWLADPEIDVILSAGGTGVGQDDVTPEALRTLLDKSMPGFGELFRLIRFDTVGASAIDSRTLAGLANGTFLFALPGTRGACGDAWEGILSKQLDSRYRPSNCVSQMPRLASPHV